MTLCDYLKDYPKRVGEKLPNSLGISATFLPGGAYLETAVVGMTDLVSMQARAYAALFTAAVVPGVLDLREASRKYFSATNKGMRRIAHDTAFYVSISGGYKVAAYLASGERDLERILFGTVLTSVATAVLAPVLLGTGDFFEKSYARLKLKRKMSLRTAAAALLIGTSLLTTAYIYNKDWRAQQAQEKIQIPGQ